MNASVVRFSFVFLVLSPLGLGQTIEALAQKWVARFSGPGILNNIPAAVAVDAAGDAFIASYTEVANGTYRATVYKLAGGTGSLLWQWQSQFEEVSGRTPAAPAIRFCLAIGADGNPVVLFRLNVVKLLGASGSQLWSTSIPPSYYSGPYQLALDPGGNVLLAGSLTGRTLTKLNGQTGALAWERAVATVLNAVKIDASGNVYVAGVSLAQTMQPCTGKISPEGEVLWSAVESDPAERGGARLLALDGSGDVVVATYEGRLLKYRGSDGARQWSAAGLTNPNDLLIDAAGAIYLASGGGTWPNLPSSLVGKYSGTTGTVSWLSSADLNLSTYKVNLLLLGNQLLTYGSNSVGLALSGAEPQTGTARWYQQYVTSPGRAVATTLSRTVTLVAAQPDGGIIVAGSAPRSTTGYYEPVILRYAPGPSLANAGPDWVLTNRAQLKVSSVANSAPAEVYWEYGLTIDYGNETPRQKIYGGWLPTGPTYYAAIEGLAENTFYHARAVAVSTRGITVSPDFTFTTGWDANGNKLPDEWELAKWGNTTSHSALGDDDRDGTINLIEYALDRHPRVSDAATAAPRIAIDPEGHFSMTVSRRPHLKLEVEASTDLISWIPAIVVAEDDAGFTAREEFPPDTPGGRFLRLRASGE